MPKKQLYFLFAMYFLALLATLIANFTDSIIDKRLEFGEEGTLKLIFSVVGVMAIVIFLFIRGYKAAKAFVYVCLFVNLGPGVYYWWDIGFRLNLGTVLSLFAIGCFGVVAFYQSKSEITEWLQK